MEENSSKSALKKAKVIKDTQTNVFVVIDEHKGKLVADADVVDELDRLMNTLDRVVTKLKEYNDIDDKNDN